ncbi:HNH endonuclease [bacterium]|nr:HNH endonuclease [bacterium]
MLIQERLKEMFNYNPETGLFMRLIGVKGGRKGAISGFLQTNGYLQVRIDGRAYLSHRLACLYMTGRWPKNQMDHINHIRTDNRWSNLREATQQENLKNKSMQKNNKSGVNGVHWRKSNNKWRSKIIVNRKELYLGEYDNFDDAAAVRKEAEIKYGFHENHGIER